MASEILGLFTSPEMYRQQQDRMMQEQAVALAQLDPYQSVRFGAVRAGQQFGQGLAGLLGAQDPQLAVISRRQALSQQLDPSDPDSILAAAQQAAEAGDQQFALSLADYARKAQSDLALVQQRTREGRAAATPKELQIAEERARLLQQRRAVEASSPDAPGRAEALQLIDDTLAGLPLGTGGGSRQVPDVIEIANARADARNLVVGSPERSKFLDEEIGRLSTKDTQQKLGEFERILNMRYPDVPENAAARATLLDQYLKSEIEGKAKGKGTTVETSIKLDAGKAGEAAAKTLGPELIDVKGKEAALDSLAEAKKLLNQGIYAGAYGPAQQFIAKYSGVGSAEKVANTETFLAFIGETVVPRLKEFGGNDSEQELAYLNRIMGGDLSVEPKALARILDQAEIKINRGIARLRRQAESAEKRQPLTSTLPPPPPAAAPTPPAATPPRSVKFNDLPK
jgi:hypothetical protein